MSAQLSLPNPQSYIEPARTRNQTRLLDLYFDIRRKCRNRLRCCWAGNEYFAKLLGCSVDTITRLIARLKAWGVISVEQVVGVERRIRILMAPERLKAMLFRGHESNRRSSFCPKNAGGSAGTVAEGHNRVNPTGSPSHLSEGEKTTNVAAGVVVSSPSASSLEIEALAALQELGIPEAQAAKIAKGQPLEKVRQAARAVKAYLQGKSGNVIALAYTAVREGWNPPAPAPVHASDLGLRPTRLVEDPEKARQLAAEKQARETLESAVETAWSGLELSEREARLKAALAEVLESCSGIVRDRVLKAGTGHAQVVSVAKSRVRAELQGRAS